MRGQFSPTVANRPTCAGALRSHPASKAPCDLPAISEKGGNFRYFAKSPGSASQRKRIPGLPPFPSAQGAPPEPLPRLSDVPQNAALCAVCRVRRNPESPVFWRWPLRPLPPDFRKRPNKHGSSDETLGDDSTEFTSDSDSAEFTDYLRRGR